MAEAQEPTPAGQEPSMEEILASIRKIISDDAPGEPAAAAPAADTSSDVIELTQMVQDDGSVVDVQPASPPPLPEVKPMPPEPTPVPVATAPAPKVAAETLASEPTVSTAANALSALANTVEIERLASAPLTNSPLGNGSRTLEDMVLELMRPLLKQWLDQNLPATVDRLVQKEIERISKKAQD